MQVGQGAEEVGYFAALTLRTKLQHDISQLPASSLDSLRSSLLAHVVARAEGPANIITQLCLALACLALHMPSWEHPIQDVYQHLGTDARTLRALLTFLAVLPEQAMDAKTGVHPTRRRAFSAGLSAASVDVYRLLVHIHVAAGDSRETPREREGVLRCFKSWIRHSFTVARPAQGPTDDADAGVDPSVVFTVCQPLLQTTFDSLTRPGDDVYEAAVDAAVEVVKFMGGGGRDPWHDEVGAGHGEGGAVNAATSLARQGEALRLLVPWCVRLAPLLAVHVANEDEDAARGLCRFFAEVGEQTAAFIVPAAARRLPALPGVGEDEAVSWATSVTSAILAATSQPPSEVAEISFNFWYVCMIEICDRCDPESRQLVVQAWTPAFLQLASALRVHMRMPQDSESWGTDQADDFRKFRYACGDGLSDASRVCGGNAVLHDLIPSVVSAKSSGAFDGGDWRDAEAALQAVKMVAPSVQHSSTVPIDLLTCVVEPPPPQHRLLQVACLGVISGFAPWFNCHLDWLGPVLVFVATSLQGAVDAEVLRAACAALKELCEACCEHLSTEPWATNLMQLVPAASASSALSAADWVDIIQGLGTVFSLVPRPKVEAFLDVLAGPLLARLSAPAPGLAPASSTEVCGLLDQLGAVVRYTAPAVHEFADTHPVGQVLERAWPILVAVQGQLPRDTRYATAPGAPSRPRPRHGHRSGPETWRAGPWRS